MVSREQARMELPASFGFHLQAPAIHPIYLAIRLFICLFSVSPPDTVSSYSTSSNNPGARLHLPGTCPSFSYLWGV